MEQQIFLCVSFVLVDLGISVEILSPFHSYYGTIESKGKKKWKHSNDLAECVKDTSAFGNFSVSDFGKNTYNTWNSPKYIVFILQDHISFAV